MQNILSIVLDGDLYNSLNISSIDEETKGIFLTDGNDL